MSLIIHPALRSYVREASPKDDAPLINRYPESAKLFRLFVERTRQDVSQVIHLQHEFRWLDEPVDEENGTERAVGISWVNELVARQRDRIKRLEDEQRAYADPVINALLIRADQMIICAATEEVAVRDLPLGMIVNDLQLVSDYWEMVRSDPYGNQRHRAVTEAWTEPVFKIEKSICDCVAKIKGDGTRPDDESVKRYINRMWEEGHHRICGMLIDASLCSHTSGRLMLRYAQLQARLLGMSYIKSVLRNELCKISDMNLGAYMPKTRYEKAVYEFVTREIVFRGSAREQIKAKAEEKIECFRGLTREVVEIN